MKCKKILNNLMPLLICMILTLPLLSSFQVKADGSGMVDPVYCQDGTLFPVIDAADLMTDDEENELAQHIYQVEDKYESAIVIVTIDDLGSRNVEEYGDDFYDYNGYGYNGTNNGILFLIDISTRQWHITTTGTAINIFTDSAQEDLIDACKSSLSAGYYYQAFDQFVSACDERQQDVIDSKTFTTGKFLICLIVGLVLGLIVLLMFIGQLKTVHWEAGASNYSQKGLSLSRKQDRFIRTTVTKTARPKESSGSSTHSGSSGTSHGGSSGSF
ncbi:MULTISPECIES: TPM domain-containing protein [unclassified Butyrivibrio]|uniref:TPM domain-containing protein n=1 Tax=unclassified Butyrivibrio TaxID=2639466 RepID=UPI00047DDFCB|nr:MULTISPECIES: TPM domain-containing protein [unclassified Butyrivibrio]